MTPSRSRWVDVAVAAGFVMVGTVTLASRALTGRGVALFEGRTPDGLLAVITAGDARGRRVFVDVGAVTNNAGAGGDALASAAHEAIVMALAARPEVTTAAPATGQRGARVMGARGHVFDANIQSVRVAGESVRAAVSIVVSTSPARAYEFESTAAVTISGTGATTPEGQADAVRRAMQRAVQGACDQLAR